MLLELMPLPAVNRCLCSEVFCPVAVVNVSKSSAWKKKEIMTMHYIGKRLSKDDLATG
jgi:hypothetical protein